ncbi:hypothetical protein [Sphingomonas sp. URHD0057]|uniref:hypothetical protein n=1 Tax=Sphingomonas sp. URHD0057 TaxID=1380389 RepID=UPI000490BE6B|nr:hypothetical protein [Sphingomonas sp. URHD0057]
MRVGAGLALVEFLLASAASAATLGQGRSEYELNHVAKAEGVYASIIADPAAPASDKAGAERELARVAWLVDGDAPRALEHLDAALHLGDKPCDSAELKARVLRESGRFDESIRESNALLAACPDAAERDAIRTHLIGARLDLAAKTPSRSAQLLAEAKTEEAQFTPDADIEAARVRLETALLTDDAAAALAAWKDYFWIEDSDAPQALQDAGATALFVNGLRSGATADDRLKLTELLVRAGFAQSSQRFAAVHDLNRIEAGNPTWERVQTYWAERAKLEAKLLELHRAMARGKSDNGGVLAAAKAFTAALMTAAGATGDPSEALRKYYGILGTAGQTNGYPSMHGGHVIEDRDDQVTQYGHTAKIHFVAIDNMISNGFTSWLWDGSAAVGGWTANGVIVQVRPRYVQSPLTAFQQTRDSEARRTLISRGNQRSVEDIAKLKQRAVATLDGLGSRLQLQVVDRVATVARTKSHDDAGFRRAFLAEYARANFNQSIYVHEGRHAIDETLGIKVEQPVLEYQAKLSELALTDYPRMALGNMDRSLEGDGPHDVAGAKIFDQYRRWMEAHTDRILGYDAAVPVLAQFDKLSDDQIREIARSLDPLPNGKSSPAKLSELP